jgi:predicted phosphate transport protein (TIGR00153 family)
MAALSVAPHLVRSLRKITSHSGATTMLSRLLPRQTNFFDFFEQHAAISVAGAHELEKLAKDNPDVEEIARRIKDLEHKADEVTHTCMETLHTTFITPIDRNDIHRLASKLDDIMDLIDGAARQVSLFEITSLPESAREATTVLVLSTEAVERAVKGLRSMKNATTILGECVRINELENQADRIKASAVAHLFREQSNAVVVLKWHEVYQALENVTDACEDVANVIEGIVLEHA